MKKLMKKVGCVALAVLTSLSMVSLGSCGSDSSGSNNIPPINTEGKTKLTANVYFGEYGFEWLKRLSAEWSNTNDNYWIDVDYSMDLSAAHVKKIEAGDKADIYFTEDPNFQTIFGEYLEDLSDVLEMKPEGTRTIGEKIKNLDEWKKVASKDGAVYMLPNTLSPLGLIYDHGRFQANGWLCTDASGNLTVGKDGVAGTYDDGQPQTWQEFNTMLGKITRSSVSNDVFCYMGAKNPGYVNNILYAYLAQYLGEEQYSWFIEKDSHGNTVKLLDGTETVIGIDDGYKFFSIDGMDKMSKFMQDYIMNPLYVTDRTLTDSSFGVNESHVAFISDGDYAPAFLMEGNWWEFGSYRDFEANADYGGAGFGENDYRYMLLPVIEGQKTPEDQSVIFSQTGGCIAVTKSNDAKRTAALKDFICYVLRDDTMESVTKETGAIWNYNYTISEAGKEELTPFIRNTYEMMNDTDHVTIRSFSIDLATTPLVSHCGWTGLGMLVAANGDPYMVSAYRNAGSMAKFLSQLQNSSGYTDPASWKSMINLARTYGFYQN